MRPCFFCCEKFSFSISIHAPLTGCDKNSPKQTHSPVHFNPRTPYGMRLNCRNCLTHSKNFNPRTPYGMRRYLYWHSNLQKQFQSTHPLRDATINPCSFVLLLVYFNPRTPYGMRHKFTVHLSFDSLFQSTHPLRDATVSHMDLNITVKISIHAPLTGCDFLSVNLNFHNIQFQSTHPLRDATRQVLPNRQHNDNFNPRTPYGMRHRITSGIYTIRNFNPRTPYGMRPI